MATKTLMTIEQFDALPEVEGVKYELDEGVLITVLASARLFHNMIRDRLGNEIFNFLKEHKLGLVTWETDFRLSETTVRIPDISFIRAERFQGLDPHQRPEGAPDLAVEIASPSDKPDDLARKAQQYLATGSRAVWVLYPGARLAYLYKPGERIEVRDDTQSLDNSELLPGFGVQLSKIFG
ncbi:MAG TPA: Uma2 family endonuclease [Terriglobia bacterium]|nr:Uma2 family endonuclease [Terriglobia bacterium]